MTAPTAARPSEVGAPVVARSITTVRVMRHPRGRVAVHTAASAGAGRVRLRPMLLSSTNTTARVCLVPEGALLLAGDDIEIRIEVGPGAALEMVEPAGTVAYDMRGHQARWDVDVVLGPDATLCWGGEPFVLAAGATVSRHTRLRLGPGARVALRETLVLGRYGEPSGRMTQRLDVTDTAGSPILAEELTMDPNSPVALIGRRCVVASVLALGVDIEDPVLPEHRYDLATGGSWWRCLGDEVHATIPRDAWTAASEACLR